MSLKPGTNRPFSAESSTLAADERSEVEQMVQSRTVLAGNVFRTRLGPHVGWRSS